MRLSDKEKPHGIYWKNDVKQFIKDLKEAWACKLKRMENHVEAAMLILMLEAIIDELAGEGLI